MLALAYNAESRLLESANSFQVIDPRNLRHRLAGDLDFSDNRIFQQFVASLKIFLYRHFDVGKRLFLGGSL